MDILLGNACALPAPFGAEPPSPTGVAALWHWLFPAARPASAPDAAAESEWRLLARLARIGLWTEQAGAARVALSEELQHLLGLPTAAPEQAAALAAVHPEDRPRLAELLGQMRHRLAPAALEARVQPPGGALRHTRWEVQPRCDRQGRYAGLTALVQDITDWRQAEERRRQASRMDALGQLAGGLAHDFNNLLHAVLLNLDRMQDAATRALPPAQAEARLRELVDRARAAAERGGELTAQMLAYAGRHPAQRQPIDLGQAARQAVAALAGTPEARGVAVRLADPASLGGGAPLVVAADPALLRASLQALLARARAVSPDGGTVGVALARRLVAPGEAAELEVAPGWFAELSVSDAGEATPPDLLPRLFEPFFRPRADGTDPSAAGVGLAVAHGFARAHGGAVGLESAPGRGAVARLLLPLPSEAELRQLQPPPPPAPPPFLLADAALPPALAGLRVLLVEDDPDVCEITAGLLEDDGAAVTVAVDGPAALAQLRGPAPFDLLLSDVVLPGGLSGIDVVEQAAALRPALPALLASGYAAPTHEVGRAVPDGVTLLCKPYRHSDLMAAIHATLAGESGRHGPRARRASQMQ